jgi:hypothetical protein
MVNGELKVLQVVGGKSIRASNAMSGEEVLCAHWHLGCQLLVWVKNQGLFYYKPPLGGR